MATQNAADKITLAAEKRTVLGKQVKTLRRQGFVPGNVFGKEFESLAVTMNAKDFKKAYHDAGKTGVVYIDVDGTVIPTLIKEVQVHPVNDNVLHIDFLKINLKQKIETAVPLEFTGEAPAVKEGAVVMYPLDVITIEALPTNIPSSIVVDISHLAELDQTVTVADLPKSEDYVVIDDPETILVSLTAHKEESLEPDITTTIPEGEEGAVAEGEEGAATEGGEAPAEGEAAPAAEGEEKKDN